MRKREILWVVLLGSVLCALSVAASFASRVPPVGMLEYGRPEWSVTRPASQPVVSAAEEKECIAAGGTWNACGSACRGTDAEQCAAVCVAYCECADSDQCPAGFSCGDYVDGTGVCASN